MKWIIASSNAGKVAEFQEILGPLLHSRGVRLQSLKDIGFHEEIPETGETFRENARIKASAISSYTGLPVLSDDSGLEVEALGWAPGVYTARFAGPGATNASNRAKLLDELSRRGADAMERRRARFVCVLCWVEPGKEPRFFEGQCGGFISWQEKGETGFGYDPLFIPDGYSQTFAELPGSVKHALSHRGQAVQRFLDFLK
jgi:XTP/dITP diphosphohydrolase